MIVIATGISGSGKLHEAGGAPGYLVRLIEEGNRRIALQELRAIAFTEVVNDPALWEPDLCTILVTHACFWWKGHLIPGLDTHYLKLLFDETRRRMPPPDERVVQETLPGLRLAPPVRPEGIFYATIVDSIYAIQRRLDETDQWRGRLETS